MLELIYCQKLECCRMLMYCRSLVTFRRRPKNPGDFSSLAYSLSSRESFPLRLQIGGQSLERVTTWEPYERCSLLKNVTASQPLAVVGSFYTESWVNRFKQGVEVEIARVKCAVNMERECGKILYKVARWELKIMNGPILTPEVKGIICLVETYSMTSVLTELLGNFLLLLYLFYSLPE